MHVVRGEKEKRKRRKQFPFFGTAVKLRKKKETKPGQTLDRLDEGPHKKGGSLNLILYVREQLNPTLLE